MPKFPKHIVISAKQISTILISYWYQESKILENIPSIASKINKTLLSSNYSNSVIGELICEEGKLIDIYMVFLESLDIYSLLQQIEYSKLLWDIKRRSGLKIRNDVAKYLKSTKWWKNRKAGFDLERKRINTIKKVMKD